MSTSVGLNCFIQGERKKITQISIFKFKKNGELHFVNCFVQYLLQTYKTNLKTSHHVSLFPCAAGFWRGWDYTFWALKVPPKKTRVNEYIFMTWFLKNIFHISEFPNIEQNQRRAIFGAIQLTSLIQRPQMLSSRRLLSLDCGFAGSNSVGRCQWWPGTLLNVFTKSDN